MKAISHLIEISMGDPDDQRRSRLLNILLIGVAFLAILAILATTVVTILGEVDEPGPLPLYFGSFAMLAGIAIIFAINRYKSSWAASSIFLLLLLVVFAFVDEPREVVEGRSLFMFAIPILMASVILRPYASFITAGLSSLIITIIASTQQTVPNAIAMLGFFAIAMVSWLSARSLENALTELRIINLELDQRVEERTRDLAIALGRVQAEASKNQAILEGIADGVIVFDQGGQAIVANPAIGRLLGQPFDRIIDHDIETLMNKNVGPADQEMIVSFLKSKELRHSSAKFGWGPKTLSVSFAPVLGTTGEATGTVAVFRDFTREAEIDRMKSTFVSIASHELRTPLNAIMGYVEMLEEGVYGPLSAEQRSPISRVMANTGQLLSLANNLLDQAQIEAGKLTLHVSSFSPTELTEGVTGVMEVLAQAKDLELNVDIADDVPATLRGDQQRLHQILVNLVGNAIKFTQTGGVSIRAYRPNAEHWALAVTDTGPGIPQEAQGYIFESFRQVDDSATREHRGAGLGLSIVKQLVGLMGGDITVKSQPGHGSTFTVVLPLRPPKQEESL